MTIRNLDKLFRPASVAIIGATERPHTVGAALTHNVLQAGFKGPIYPVNPKAGTLHGLPVFADIASLPTALQVITVVVPARTESTASKTPQRLVRRNQRSRKFGL